MFVTHVALMSIAAMGFLHPQTEIWTIAYVAAGVAFFSASLDIAIDAFRRELLPEVELGLGNSIHVNAYRISSLIPGSLSLILADRMPWPSVFVVTALFMLPGLAMTLLVREPAGHRRCAQDAARRRRAAVSRVHRPLRLARRAADPRVHLSLQTGRQHVPPRWPRRSTWRWASPRPTSASSPRTPACGRA
jgi:MFS family permease